MDLERLSREQALSAGTAVGGGPGPGHRLHPQCPALRPHRPDDGPTDGPVLADQSLQPKYSGQPVGRGRLLSGLVHRGLAQQPCQLVRHCRTGFPVVLPEEARLADLGRRLRGRRLRNGRVSSPDRNLVTLLQHATEGSGERRLQPLREQLLSSACHQL